MPIFPSLMIIATFSALGLLFRKGKTDQKAKASKAFLRSATIQDPKPSESDKAVSPD